MAVNISALSSVLSHISGRRGWAKQGKCSCGIFLHFFAVRYRWTQGLTPLAVPLDLPSHSPSYWDGYREESLTYTVSQQVSWVCVCGGVGNPYFTFGNIWFWYVERQELFILALVILLCVLLSVKVGYLELSLSPAFLPNNQHLLLRLSLQLAWECVHLYL